MKELACLIEIYGSVQNAILLRENLDHIEITELIEETNELRKDPNEDNNKKLAVSWQDFKENTDLDEKIKLENGKQTTLNDLLTF